MTNEKSQLETEAIEDEVEGPSVTGDRGIAAGRDVNLAQKGGVQLGGIRARHIEAVNVVEGVQVRGGDAETAAGLVKLAKAIRSGGISAEEIKTQHLVSGLQYIADPTEATASDLRREIAALRDQLAQAIADGEITDKADAEDAEEALATAEKELDESEPKGNRVVRKLAQVAEILTHSAEVAAALGKVGTRVIKLAPVAATLYQIAQKLFGG